jgi:hypothetical protein
MIGQFLKMFSSETAGQMNRTLIGGIYGGSFHPDLLTNMAAKGNFCFWLVDF